jgi:hypothetical protein
MTDQKNMPEESLKAPERKPAPTEETRFDWEKEKVVEKKEVSPDDKIVSQELRREIEMMELDEKDKGEAKIKADKIAFLGEKEKVEHLLQIAREKGLVYAIGVAKKMNEPYLLDVLHDTLASEGFYKDFTK